MMRITRLLLLTSVFTSVPVSIQARAIDAHNIDAYSISVSSSEETYAKTMSELIGRYKLALDQKEEYVKLFPNSNSIINRNFFDYVLRSIKVPVAADRGTDGKLYREPTGSLAEEIPGNDYMYTPISSLNAENIWDFSDENLGLAMKVMENVLGVYKRYAATLANKSTIDTTEWLTEGIIQLVAAEIQSSLHSAKGLIDFDTLSQTAEHDDIKNIERMASKISSAFKYSTTDILTIPFNQNNTHWIMIAVERNGDVVVIDSMIHDNSAMALEIVTKLNTQGIKDHNGKKITFKPYKETGSVNTKLQHDGYQCGVHSLVYSAAIVGAGSIKDGLAVIGDKVAQGKRVTFKDLLGNKDSASPVTQGKKKHLSDAVFANFRIQIQELMKTLHSKVPSLD